MTKARVLWVDDDNDDEGLLCGLLLFFQAENVEPVRAHGFEDARRKLRDLTSKSEGGTALHLLCDIILPQELGMGSLAWDLGMRLAFEAADLGVRRIAFLTVVQEEEVEDHLHFLRTKHCQVKLVSKPSLFEGDRIKLLVNYLITTGTDGANHG